MFSLARMRGQTLCVFVVSVIIFILLFQIFDSSRWSYYQAGRKKDGTVAMEIQNNGRFTEYFAWTSVHTTTPTDKIDGSSSSTPPTTSSTDKTDDSSSSTVSTSSSTETDELATYTTEKQPPGKLLTNTEESAQEYLKSDQHNQVRHTKHFSRSSSEKLVRDSIEAINSQNLIIPQNETCQRRFPSVIIIGIKKCGTRELLDFLHLHPHIQIHTRPVGSIFAYEMKYFRSMYRKGEEWFREQMPCSYSNQITVMKNAHYFHDALVPERIKKFNEGIKLILIVREPIARALSDYTFCNSKSFCDNGEDFSHYVLNHDLEFRLGMQNAFAMSTYDEPMLLWLKYFNLSQILIIDSEDFKRNPPAVLNKVETFLGLDHFITPEMFAYNEEKHFYCIRSDLSVTGMACYAGNRGRNHTKISPKAMAKLSKFYQPRNKRFFDLIGKSFNW